jgi:hypothetical protein
MNAPRRQGAFLQPKVIEANPPSYEFHKKLWLWFFGAVKDGFAGAKKVIRKSSSDFVD